MTTSLRLNATEQVKISEFTMEVNKILLKNHQPAIKESEVMHRILDFALRNIELSDLEQTNAPPRLKKLDNH